MKNNFKLATYILILIVVSTAFYSLFYFFSNLNQEYFQLHQAELTTNQTIFLEDGVVTNFYYANTPYTFAANLFFYIYLLVPAILLIIFSIKYSHRRNVSFKEKLILPLSFILLTFFLHSYNFYQAVGGEKIFGFYLISFYLILVFIFGLISHFIFLKIKK